LEDQYESLAFLESNEVMPGALCLVQDVLPFNETIHILLDQQEVVLGLKLASNIFVALISDPSREDG
jgi:hypothetical protein